MTHALNAHSSEKTRRHAALVAASRAALFSIDEASLDRDGAFPISAIASLHAAGLLHAPFSIAMGGCDLGSSDAAWSFDVLALIGQHSLPLGRLFEGHVNAVKLVRLHGSVANVSLLKAEADAGRMTGVWMAEDGAPLELIVGPSRFLRGRKILASGASHIRRPLIAARSDEGSRMVIPLVEDIARVDLSTWTAVGMKATATGSVDFTDLPIADDEIVGRPGDYLRSPHFRGGAWRVMAVQYGGLLALMEAYRRQIVEADRDGDPIQRMRFGDACAALETARLWVNEASRRAEDPREDPEAIDAYVDLMRGAFERAALTIIEHAQRSLGLKAFMHPNAIDRIARDLATYLRQPALDASRDSAAAYFFNRSVGV